MGQVKLRKKSLCSNDSSNAAEKRSARRWAGTTSRRLRRRIMPGPLAPASSSLEGAGREWQGGERGAMSGRGGDAKREGGCAGEEAEGAGGPVTVVKVRAAGGAARVRFDRRAGAGEDDYPHL